MKLKTKVMVDGQEKEIELDTEKLGVFTKDEVGQQYMLKETFEPELDRRVKSLTKGMIKLEEIGQKPELKQQVMDLLGVKVTPDGKPQLTADQIAQLQEEWRKKELTPAAERATKAETRSKQLLERILRADLITAAAEAHIHDHLLKPVTDGTPPPIVSMLGNIFGYSEEHDSYFVKKGDGFDFSSDPKTTGKPYKGVREFVLEWAGKKENAPFINVTKPGGAGLHQPGGGQGGTVKIEQPEGRPLTLQEYKAAQEQAGTEGRVVVNSPA